MDNYKSFRDIAVSQIPNLCMSGSGCFNDPDMLVVGMYGKGHVGMGGCSDLEYRTHFALWCLFGVPLMMGGDIRNLSETSHELLLNKELIALDQDEECRPPYLAWMERDRYCFIRHLANNEFAVGYFNLSDESGQLYHVGGSFDEMGIPYESGYGLEMTDMFTGEKIGIKRDYFVPRVEAHGCQLYRAKLVKVK